MENLKVTLVNKEEVKNLYKNWSLFAAKCYNTTITSKNNELVGKHCHETRHYSGSRSTYFIFEIDGISRVTTAQLNRHSIGVAINERSMRYVNFEDAEITIPETIDSNDELREIFNNAVSYSQRAYCKILNKFKELDITGEKATQDARYILPIGVQTAGTWGFDLEALEHFCNVRLCNRAQWEIRAVAKAIKKEVLEVLPELKNKLVPNCIKQGYCIENNRQCDEFSKSILTKSEFDLLIKSGDWNKIVYNTKNKIK